MSLRHLTQEERDTPRVLSIEKRDGVSGWAIVTTNEGYAVCIDPVEGDRCRRVYMYASLKQLTVVEKTFAKLTGVKDDSKQPSVIHRDHSLDPEFD